MTGSRQLSDGDCMHDGDTLHVQGAAAPDKAFGHVTTKRIASPVFFFNRYDVAVGQQDERRLIPRSIEARDQICATCG